ncbi:MAG: hypothetical protein M1484_01185 [Patescibacteria group bacterium]|nr:hypothetical protein [Patescibacteria group bacterium]MCL5431694.1 hypothetical protein [Patescibacteria group bacterium]
MPTKKYYCFVDETGQDTGGKIYIVSVVVPEDRNGLERFTIEAEKQSGKGVFKWGRSDPVKRLRYLETVFSQKKHPFVAYYSSYFDTRDYRNSTILTIAKALTSFGVNNKREFTVLVDALSRKDQRYFGHQLHELAFHIHKVRGVRKDENDSLIRFADNICGFVRDATEDKGGDMAKLMKKFAVEGMLVEV